MPGKRSKEPFRSCIGCRTVRPKKELIRVVKSPGGSLEWDFSRCGKAAGRGAYICARPSCWQEAQKRRALNRSLRTEIKEEEMRRLTSQLEGSGQLE